MSTAVPSSIRGVRRRADPGVAAMAAAVVGLHVAGLGLLLACTTRHDVAGGSAIGVGTGALAYSLGLRHAFDVDHIAAIDNSTRAMLRRGRTPYATGFFFALGHSSVVFAMTVLLCTSVRVFAGPLRDPGSSLHRWTGLVGAGVSGSFLLLIGAVNIGVLVNVTRVFLDLRRGRYDEDGFEQLLTARGLFSRLLGGALRRVDRPWKLYPLGLLFGLGFDTATEIGLLVLAVTAGAASLPLWAMLSLPVLFAAGMVLLDTVDGVLMCRAYAWAFVRPVRKVYYNLTMTALSVFLALFIGLQIVLQLLGRTLGLDGGVWRLADRVDLQTAGYVVVLVFLAVWGLAAGIWRFGRIEQRWSAPADGGDRATS